MEIYYLDKKCTKHKFSLYHTHVYRSIESDITLIRGVCVNARHVHILKEKKYKNT